MTPAKPPWVATSHEFVCRIRPGVRIRALRLDAKQWAEYVEFLQTTPRTLWGYPVKKRS
jgi:hypothetical protein